MMASLVFTIILSEKSIKSFFLCFLNLYENLLSNFIFICESSGRRIPISVEKNKEKGASISSHLIKKVRDAWPESMDKEMRLEPDLAGSPLWDQAQAGLLGLGGLRDPHPHPWVVSNQSYKRGMLRVKKSDPTSEITTLETSSDLSFIAIGLSNGQINLFELSKDLKIQNTILSGGHSILVSSIAFQPDSSSFISSSFDGSIALWSLQSKSLLKSFYAHEDFILSLTFSPHGHFYVSTSEDKLAKLWHTDLHPPVRIFAQHFMGVITSSFHPNLKYLATAGYDLLILLWDIESGSVLRCTNIPI
jgi:WD40 repeat protein